MRRLRWLLAVPAAILALPSVPAAAGGGGGGCPEPVTSATGTVVVMRDICFSPTILRVRPGTTVTFVNRDDFPHNVIGANGSWARFRRLELDEAVTRPFREPGVFPYTCAYHPGMLGAVVVGRGVVVETAFLPSTPEEPEEAPADGKAAALVVPDPPMRAPSSLDPASEAGWSPTAFLPWAVAAAAVTYAAFLRRRVRRA